jgi:hypothetical protein
MMMVALRGGASAGGAVGLRGRAGSGGEADLCGRMTVVATHAVEQMGVMASLWGCMTAPPPTAFDASTPPASKSTLANARAGLHIRLEQINLTTAKLDYGVEM